MHHSHTGDLMFNLIIKVLQALLGSIWYKKLLSVRREGPKNMTGRVQAAVTLFHNIYLPVLLRVWFPNHKSELIVQ